MFRKKLQGVFLSIICCLAIYSNAAAQSLAPIPSTKGYVSDYVGIVEESDQKSIEVLSLALESQTTAQFAVAVIASVKPETVEQYAVRLFEQWGIGRKGKDNGVLLLVAYNDRELRIETGYGLEGAIPDLAAKRIIDEIIVPEFKAKRFSQGIAKGAEAIVSLVANEYNVTLAPNQSQIVEQFETKKLSGQEMFMLLLVIIFIIIFFMGGGGFWGPPMRGGGWPGSSSGRGGFGGGGFGGFGGGRSGGGGAGGRW